jgi:hypothetical protein
VKNCKMGDLSDFESGQTICVPLAGASVPKTVTLLGASKATVSKVMSAYTNHGRTTSTKRISEWKSTLTERDRRTMSRIVSKNHRTTATQMTGQRN